MKKIKISAALKARLVKYQKKDEPLQDTISRLIDHREKPKRVFSWEKEMTGQKGSKT